MNEKEELLAAEELLPTATEGGTLRVWLARLTAWLSGLLIVLLSALFAWLQN
jgi:hypothetical protein